MLVLFGQKWAKLPSCQSKMEFKRRFAAHPPRLQCLIFVSLAAIFATKFENFLLHL
jgi:hypothetical protein